MSALVHEAGSVSGRTTVILLTAAVHVVLIAGLMVTGVIARPESAPSPMKWVPVVPDEPIPVPMEVNDPTRDWKPSTPYTSVPDVPVEDPGTEIINLPPQDVHVGSTVPAETVSPIPATSIAYRSARPTDDFYPAASIRGNESGVVVVNVCISASGALDPQPQVRTSSGYPRLDGAAIRWVQEGARFTPATRNGEPVADCKPMRVNFTLKGSR